MSYPHLWIPQVVHRLVHRIRRVLGATCPQAVYPQFPQAIWSTATEQRRSGQRAGDNLWIPRGFLEESTGCPRIHAQCAQLARIWGPSWGRPVDAVWTTKPVHSRLRFILELSPGHPQADTRCELGKPAESTVSTGPITTPVLHLENFSSKQVVWTSLERTAPPHRAGKRDKDSEADTGSSALTRGRHSTAAQISICSKTRTGLVPLPALWRSHNTALRRSYNEVRLRPTRPVRRPGTRIGDRSHIEARPAACRRLRHIDEKSSRRAADEKW